MSDRAEFIDAATTQAVNADRDCEHCQGLGRVPSSDRIIHCLGRFTGSDWSLEAVLAAIKTAQGVEWLDAYTHQLRILDEKGVTWRFDVTRPEEQKP